MLRLQYLYMLHQMRTPLCVPWAGPTAWRDLQTTFTVETSLSPSKLASNYQ